MTQQQGTPTVGDTLTVVRYIAAPPGAVVQARSPTDSTLATLISPPLISREGDSIRIAYTVAVWSAGHGELVLPGAIVVDQAGHVDTLADARVPLDIASVLPAGRPPANVPLRAAQLWIAPSERSNLPFLVLIPATLLLLAAVHWWWRRRGPPAAIPAAAAEQWPALTAERVDDWLAAGEGRVLLEHIDAMARHRDDFADWRVRAASVRFAPANDPELESLVREGWQRWSQERAK